MGPQDPRMSNTAEWERSAAKDRGTWGQYVAVCLVSNSPLTHNPFATISNKVWEVYFSKEVCSFVIIVDFVSACICVWLYTYYIYAAEVLIFLFFQFYSVVFYYYYNLLRAFPTRISRWFLTGVWVKASLLKSPGHFSVFWRISIMLLFGLSHTSSCFHVFQFQYQSFGDCIEHNNYSCITVTLIFHSFSSLDGLYSSYCF